uniref:G-protein coupled receptors family 2 profile 2 domain-containing protein n=1 Tax=Nothobranchius furzeri TaxID=105023 RepID=A0A8C6KCD7_NOTFU
VEQTPTRYGGSQFSSSIVNLNFQGPDTKMIFFTLSSALLHSGFTGGRPNWTNAGCETIKDANGGIICQCTHLTFFAILLVRSFHLKYLTTISQAGCGLSMFFLGVGLFMHFLIRRTKASQTTVILIHLMLAMFLLNFTFLINNSIAKMKNLVGCQVMAAIMHFSMLATFSWFAGQAFHLCLQLYTGGQIFSLFPFPALPAVIAIIIACLGKYGLETIYTDDPELTVLLLPRCWITDVYVHYIVNIGYYSLVFLFTFTTVIITVSWLFGLKKSKVAGEKGGTSGKSVLTIMGLCCQLGVTWGFAFFAYGALRIPATYIFTILNSFQDFLCFHECVATV